MALRKVNIATTALTDNAGSFVNQTARRLHIRKSIGTLRPSSAWVIGDLVESSLDEVPTNQATVNDSRSHIALLTGGGEGGTGGLFGKDRVVLSWNRDDLVLDPDEALFVNNSDVSGAPPTRDSWNLFYQD